MPKLLSHTLAAAAAAGLALSAAAGASAATLNLTRIAPGTDFINPIHGAAPPGDSSRLFILERDTGFIRIYDRASNTVLSDPFLTVTGLGSDHPEQGAMSIAFAPDYQTSGLFYVSLINEAGDHQVIEYQVSGDPNIADATSARTVITVDHPDDGELSHYGGWIGFGPNDGYLYISTGDSNGNPINDASQMTDNQLGSILRIDVGADAFPADPLNNYAAPTDNPFVGGPGDDAVWAFGLRNPYRPAFDPLTGDLYIADVGEDLREEINIGAPGANYGWPGYEGTVPFDLGLLTGDTTNLTFPVYEYGHGGGMFEGFSVTGGGVYRGPIAELDGLYFFGDFVNQRVWSFRYDPSTGTIGELMAWSLALDGGALNNLASFAFDADGNMYLMDFFTGDIFMVAGVSDIPLPGAFIVMLAGLASLGGAARMKRAAP